MNGYDIQIYERLKSKCTDNDLIFKVSGEKIMLLKKSGVGLGVFDSMGETYAFVCGFEWGKRNGEN